MHVEGAIIHFDHIRQNRNAYPMKEKNCSDDSSIVLLDEYHLGNTIVAGNTYLGGNRTL